MGANVYANGRAVSCKQGDGQSICAFPDVCFTPPQTPATPPGVPIPYPNTGVDGDTSDGSKDVTIGGKEVMLKNKSYFKKSTGNEAGSAPKKGLVTSTNTGKVYFNAWSMDVLIEGENVVRHLDLTTHNHGSFPGNSPTWPFLADMAAGGGGGGKSPCSAEKAKKDEACSGATTKAERCDSDECRNAMKCELQPYSSTKETGCCSGQTPHHIVEVHCFTPPGMRASGERLPGFELYDDAKAPCVCCDESSRYKGDHGSMHAIQNMAELGCMDPEGERSQMGGKDGAWTYKAAKKAGVTAHKETFKSAGCSEECIEAQLDAYHKQCGVKNGTELRADRSPLKPEQKKFGQSVLARQSSVD